MKVGNCYNRAIFVEGKLVLFDINKTSLIKESDYLVSQLNKLFDIIYQHVCDKLVKYWLEDEHIHLYLRTIMKIAIKYLIRKILDNPSPFHKCIDSNILSIILW